MWKEILTAFKNAFFEIPIMITYIENNTVHKKKTFCCTLEITL
jgi:hypothetical protein